jgi:hypothetical protein
MGTGLFPVPYRITSPIYANDTRKRITAMIYPGNAGLSSPLRRPRKQSKGMKNIYIAIINELY